MIRVSWEPPSIMVITLDRPDRRNAVDLPSLQAILVALATEFNGTMATIVIACLIVASILLAPAIVLGYAVKAADREDRERGL